jgi:asparagine synthase (glutamine-hydrolysing)
MKAMLLSMCGDLLPADVLAARHGRDLTHVFFGDTSREFAANWTGAGLDESIVDAETLRANWLSDTPDPRTAGLLQYAWLTDHVAGTGSIPTAGELVLTHSNQRGAS